MRIIRTSRKLIGCWLLCMDTVDRFINYFIYEMEFLLSKQLMILSKYSWTIYVALWFFCYFKKGEKENHYFRKRNKYSFLIFCFLFLKISLIVLLGLRAFSCDFGMELLYYVVVVQSLNCQLFVTPWTAVRQDSSPSLSSGVCSNSFPWYYQPSHPLWPSFPSALKLCQHQGLFNESGAL